MSFYNVLGNTVVRTQMYNSQTQVNKAFNINVFKKQTKRMQSRLKTQGIAGTLGTTIQGTLVTRQGEHRD